MKKKKSIILEDQQLGKTQSMIQNCQSPKPIFRTAYQPVVCKISLIFEA